MRHGTALYLPTIDGKPARFDGDQLCYVTKRWPAVPVRSRQAVVAQIRRTRTFRTRYGYGFERHRYDYVRVEVPA